MSKVQMLRCLVNQRLTAAAEEIFGVFERTIAEYEEELCRSKEENERQRKLLDAVFNPQLRLHRADVQQLLVVKEEVPPEQQDWSSSLDQEDPEPPHIKEDQEELWTSQEREQLQGLEEADIKFSFTPVKSEDDEEKPQSSHLHQRQTEQMETEADGEDCGGPEPDRNSDPDRHFQLSSSDKASQCNKQQTDDSVDWKETREPQSGLNSLNNEVSVSDSRCSAGEKPFRCSECGKRFGKGRCLKRHMIIHTGERPFSCSLCSKRFIQKVHLADHMARHIGVKPFSCLVCGKGFIQKRELTFHMARHTGEKPFSCSVCKKSFAQRGNLQTHMRIHTRERPFKCSVCGQSFLQKAYLKRHMITHTGEKPYSCSVCKKSFAQRGNLQTHTRIHTGEKPFICSLCEKTFIKSGNLKVHMRTHTGEKPSGCC
ncbi:gastrula zinc finger protein XlCGF26.1-like [Cebidichthys violaceus]|uniref:gastrula zinc finger protein XlCGF26.1-like n=1 Tax=Cebidichthys violaceus TaxID=271503 RepID=UPI0035C99117